MPAVPGPPLVTGATGFAGSHLVDQLLEEQPSVAAWSHRGGRAPALARRPAGALERGGPARLRRGVASPGGAPAVGHLSLRRHRPRRGVLVGARPRVERQRARHASRARRRPGRRPGLSRSRDRFRARLPAVDRAAPGRRSDRPIRSVRRQQARAGDARISAARRRRCSSCARSTTPDRGSRRRTSRRALRGRSRRSKPGCASRCCASATSSRAATSRTSATPSARTGSLSSADDPRRPYNVCSGEAYRVRDLLDALIGLSRASIDIEVDPSRLRPSDNPVIAGDRSRIGAEAGWTPAIPIERTLDDLLNYWRRQILADP